MHKCDLNLLYDVNPKQFLSNIPTFVDQVSQVDWLNLFINSLVDAERGPELDFMRPKDPDEEIREQHQAFMASLEPGAKQKSLEL